MRSYGRLAMSRRVMINLTSGDAIEGVLWDERNPLIVVRDARLHSSDSAPVPLDGEVVIERDRIKFMQVLS